MRATINQEGILLLDRPGSYGKPQLCPFDNPVDDSRNLRCGDHCPLFGEPIDISHVIRCDNEGKPVERGPERWRLDLCRGYLVVEGVVDQRAECREEKKGKVSCYTCRRYKRNGPCPLMPIHTDGLCHEPSNALEDAAPDLLKACEAALYDAECVPQKTIDFMRNAIAKAKGEKADE